MPRFARLSPWIAALQAGVVVREHYLRLDVADRALLRELIAKSKGRPGNLTLKERGEVRRIVAELDARGAVWKLAPVGKRLRRGRR